MGQFGVCLVSLWLLNHKTALSTYCIQGVMLSILRDGAFVLIFKSMALYVAFYGIAFKWSCTGSETRVTWVQILIPLRSVCVTLGDVVALSVWF